MANSYKRGNKGINEHIILKKSAQHVFIAACSQRCQMFELLVYSPYGCQFFLQMENVLQYMTQEFTVITNKKNPKRLSLSLAK